MAKPELGTKRLCGGCGAKYYDLNRNPITCPKCGAVFQLAQSVRPAKASKAAATEEDEDLETEEDGAELVSLEEADAEAEGDSAVTLDGDDDDEIADNAADDDVFIDDEDDDEDVPGIVVERDDEDTDR
ncbi:TIGR02300 family protein [Stappia taiwanensis]|uniref:TIGR02300 family protein n=1 Tax=Stappia taiwanensis TaxID=992267 RepID=A0A838Y3M4_9HYPH|nr:TIGR02300 family protein [Stappia taiwanensis]MBA4613460.1 TIGR02300 family protein [Stappia taiwanensis]GGF02497.1 TIGR02300 family protein [Stappia taiwanensis]